MNTTDMLKKLQIQNTEEMGGDKKLGAIFSLSELQILMAYVLDGTMTPAEIKEFIAAKLN